MFKIFATIGAVLLPLSIAGGVVYSGFSAKNEKIADQAKELAEAQKTIASLKADVTSLTDAATADKALHGAAWLDAMQSFGIINVGGTKEHPLPCGPEGDIDKGLFCLRGLLSAAPAKPKQRTQAAKPSAIDNAFVADGLGLYNDTK